MTNNTYWLEMPYALSNQGIKKGDRVLIDTEAAVKSGDVVNAVAYEGLKGVFTIYFPGNVLLTADGIKIKVENVGDVRILGKVVEVRKAEEAVFTYIVTEDSFSGLGICPGSEIEFNRDSPVKNGDIAMVEVNGERLARVVFFNDLDGITLVLPHEGRWYFKQSQVKILGRAMEVRREL